MARFPDKILPSITVEIYDLAGGGMGVGKTPDGKVVFVPFSAPGDVLDVEIVEDDKRYAEARIVAIQKESPMRVQPRCPAFQKCGGCEWQHIEYKEQWKAKVKGLKHTLKRLGMEVTDQWEEFPADDPWNYRNRVQLRGFRDKLGFFERKSKNIVPITECHIAKNEINNELNTIRQEGRTLYPYKVEVEVDDNKQVHVTWNSNHSARGFTQVYSEQNIKLQQWVAGNIEKNELLLDLYGGNGNLSQAIYENFNQVHCVDYGSPEENSTENYLFHRSDVRTWLDKSKDSLQGKSLSVIFDPPREGLGPDLIPIIEILKQLDVRQILMIGCDANAWARTVHRLERHGWALESLGALDFFPQTHHVEALAKLRK